LIPWLILPRNNGPMWVRHLLELRMDYKEDMEGRHTVCSLDIPKIRKRFHALMRNLKLERFGQVIPWFLAK
jgi:hypothetical protein